MPRFEFEHPLLLWLAGPTGAGKSAFEKATQYVMPVLTGRDVVVRPEASVTENPFFNFYYNAMQAGQIPNLYAQKSQDYFMNFAIKQNMAAKRDLAAGKHVLEGGSIINHIPYEINLHDDGLITDREFLKYWEKLARILDLLTVPHGAILISLSAEQQLHRIHDRAFNDSTRLGELKAPPEFWRKQIEYYALLRAIGSVFPLDKIPGSIRYRFEQPEYAKLIKPLTVSIDSGVNDYRTPEGATLTLTKVLRAFSSEQAA